MLVKKWVSLSLGTHCSPVTQMLTHLIDEDFWDLQEEAICSRLHRGSTAEQIQGPGLESLFFSCLPCFTQSHSRDPSGLLWAGPQDLSFFLSLSSSPFPTSSLCSFFSLLLSTWQGGISHSHGRRVTWYWQNPYKWKNSQVLCVT